MLNLDLEALGKSATAPLKVTWVLKWENLDLRKEWKRSTPNLHQITFDFDSIATTLC